MANQDSTVNLITLAPEIVASILEETLPVWVAASRSTTDSTSIATVGAVVIRINKCL